VKQQKPDYIQRALSCYRSLRLEEALKYFERAKREQRTSRTSQAEAFYKQRAEINLVLGGRQCSLEALSLAQKGGLNELAFLASIATGNFETAVQYIPDMMTLALQPRNDRQGSAVSQYELCHLIIFMAFSGMKCADTNRIADRILEVRTHNLTHLTPYTSTFCARKFANLIGKEKDLMKMFELSIYTGPVAQQLMEAIRLNVVANYVQPFARIALKTIATDCGMTQDRILAYVIRGIRHGKINGKVDLVDNVFLGSGDGVEERKLRGLFESIVVIREKFNNSLWRAGYKQQMKGRPASK
jgi:hypothetical protein